MDLKREIKRKLFHLVSSAIPIGYWILGKPIALTVIGLFFLFALSLEIARIFIPRAREPIHKMFSPIMRITEEHKISGATYLLAGAWITIYFFPQQIAILSLLMLTLSDSAAALIGKGYGQIKMWTKSLEGSMAFFTTSAVIAVLLPGIGFKVGMAGIITGTLVEVLPIPFNDNFTVPIFSAMAMSYVALM